MQSIIKVGQRFKFTVLTDDAPSERQGVVIRVLSNQEEGLGLDVDQYMSYWVEARELPETESSTNLTFVRSTDGKAVVVVVLILLLFGHVLGSMTYHISRCGRC